MKDCIISQFNNILNDKSLPTFAAFTLEVNSLPTKEYLKLASDSQIEVKVITPNGTSSTIAGSGNYPVEAQNNPVRVEVSDKYELTECSLLYDTSNFADSFDLSQLKYCEKLATIDFRNSKRVNSVESFAYMKALTSVIATRSIIIGRIEDMVEQYIKNYPSLSKTLIIQMFASTLAPSFNEKNENVYYKVVFNNGSASVYGGGADGETYVSLGSYDGTNWTYNN